MHRTLKAETTPPPSGNLSSQQRRFNQFREEYNQQHPHEALNQETPGSKYHPSRRRMPPKLPAIDYPAHYEARLVSHNGGIRWKCQWVNVTQTLGGQYVGLEEVHNDLWDVYFGPLKLGRLNENSLRIEDHLGRTQRKRKVLPMSLD
jgi:putative transposase